jgi:hypothetical protein
MVSHSIGVNVPVPGTSSPGTGHGDSNLDPYRAAVAALLIAAFLGAVGGVVAGIVLVNPVLLDAGVTLAIASGTLYGVLVAQTARLSPLAEAESIGLPPATSSNGPSEIGSSSDGDATTRPLSPARFAVRGWAWFRSLGKTGTIQIATASLGFLAVVLLLFGFPASTPPLVTTAIAAASFLVAAGVAAIAARYLGDIDPLRFPEAVQLCRGARVVAWILIVAAISTGVAWAGQNAIVQILHFTVLAVNAVLCFQMFSLKPSAEKKRLAIFSLEIAALSVLGGRANIFGSILDAGERQLGIDLRSTWALTIVRRSLEPLLIGLALLGWLSTSTTVIGLQEQGLVERLGTAFHRRGRSFLEGWR